jgi:ligand-binding sensor protein
MLQDGRLKGVKIGQQWRFPLREIERLVGNSGAAAQPATPDLDSIFPTHCVQTIQDLFSEVSQIGAIVIDAQGQPVTLFSQPNPFYLAVTSSPAGRQAYQATWERFSLEARRGSQQFTCHAGLDYVGAPILDRDEFAGVFLAGPLYWQPADPAEEAGRLRRLSANLDLPLAALQQAVGKIQVVDANQQAQVKSWPASAARAIHSILKERTGFVDRLQQIASLTQL